MGIIGIIGIAKPSPDSSASNFLKGCTESGKHKQNLLLFSSFNLLSPL